MFGTKCREKINKDINIIYYNSAKNTNTKYIYLECKGEIVNYYCNKFGFEIINTKTSYDSDEEIGSYYDDEGPYHIMRLDLSEVI